MKILWLGWEDLYASKRVQDAAKNMAVELDVVGILDLSFITDGEHVGIYRKNTNILQEYDVLCIRLFHPYISEILTIAHLFKEAGKVVVDESLTDEGYAVSKMHDYLVLAGSGIAVPRSYQIYERGDVESYAAELGYPVVLKGLHGSQGQHVFRVSDEHQLRRRIRQYPDGELLLQEFLPADEDYRVIVVGYEALPTFVKRQPRPGDFRTNFTVEGEGVAENLSRFSEFRTIAESAARILRREFAGIDIRMRNNVPVILEVNRRPDFRGFEDATHLDVAGAFVGYLTRKFQRRKRH